MKQILITACILSIFSMTISGQSTNKYTNATERAQIKLDEYDKHLDLSPQQKTEIFDLLEAKNLRADSVRVNYKVYSKSMLDEINLIPKEVSLRSRRQQVKQIKKRYSSKLQPMKDSLNLFNAECTDLIISKLSEDQVKKLEEFNTNKSKTVSRPQLSTPNPER